MRREKTRTLKNDGRGAPDKPAATLNNDTGLEAGFEFAETPLEVPLLLRLFAGF